MINYLLVSKFVEFFYRIVSLSTNYFTFLEFSKVF